MPPPFSHLFRTMLIGAGILPLASCGESVSTNCSGPVVTHRSKEVDIDVRVLEDALADGSVSGRECAQLCSVASSSCELIYDEAVYEQLLTADPFGAGGAGGASSSLGGSAEQWLKVLTIQCEYTSSHHCRGRRHASWRGRAAVMASDPIGTWFARTAADEAASVRSFRTLSAELREVAIPPALRSRLRNAARDEIRHARAMERFAEMRGAQRPSQRFAALGRRSLVAIALENAREGCVAETYAGLLTLHQAHAAQDAELRAALAVIADEECGHAELAWDLHTAFMALLDEKGQTRVKAALHAAIDGLSTTAESTFGDVPGPARRQLGLPEASVEARYRSELAEVLRARAAAPLRRQVGLVEVGRA